MQIMKVEKAKFENLLSKNYLFNIPYFQRYYDWDWSQTNELLLDFKDLIDNKYKNKKNHFIGFFAKINEKSKGIGYHFTGIFVFSNYDDQDYQTMIYKKISNDYHLQIIES